VKAAAALGLNGTYSERRLSVKEMMMPPARPTGKKLDGDVDSQVKTLVALLRSEARVI
jgi:hypothetical protein